MVSLEQICEWMKNTIVCDNLCDKGRCGMCFHKHNECNELKFIRSTMLGD